MAIKITLRALGWCAIINMCLLLWWFLFFVFAHDWVYFWHSKWFNIPNIPVETFNTIHYAGMLFYKLAIFMLNIIPFFALRIAAKKYNTE